MSVDVYLSGGANVGDRLETLHSAVFALDDVDGLAVADVSAVYETLPWGGVDQPAYLNLAVRAVTSLEPAELLAELQLTEAAYGRDRAAEARWGPRTLDLDILLYGDRVVNEPDLQIPHPRMTERAFVLVPLLEIAPGLTLPDASRLTTHVARLAPLEGIELHVRLPDLPGSTPRPAGPRSPAAVPADQWRPPRTADPARAVDPPRRPSP